MCILVFLLLGIRVLSHERETKRGIAAPPLHLLSGVFSPPSSDIETNRGFSEELKLRGSEQYAADKRKL